MKKLLLFDFDGTISDSMNVTFAGYKSFNRRFNLPDIQTKTEFAKFFETNFYEAAVQAGLQEDQVPEIGKCYGDYLKMHSDEIQAFPDMQKVISELAKENYLYIVTSITSDAVRKQLLGYEISEFKDIYGVDRDANKVRKIGNIVSLHPDIDKNNIYMIGDTAGDIVEGKAAGTRTIGVSWGYHTRELLEAVNPNFIADTPDQLLEYLSEN